MRNNDAQLWSPDGVTIRYAGPDAKRDAMLVRHGQQAGALHMSHAEAAALDAYEARILGLPPALEANLIVSVAGRIDHPAFAVHYRLEPFDQSHAWARVARVGALIEVGERRYLANLAQYTALEAIHAMQNAGGDIARRLAAWEPLRTALQVTHRARVMVEGPLPRITIERLPKLPAGALSREGTALIHPAPQAAWAMLPRRRYILRLAPGML